jgi:hypothetical protein
MDSLEVKMWWWFLEETDKQQLLCFSRVGMKLPLS